MELSLLLKPKGKRNFGLSIDAPGVLNLLLADNLALAMHGHMHAPFCGLERRLTVPPGHPRVREESQIAVLGAGSYGLSNARCNGIHFEVITVEPEEVVVSR